MSAQLVPGLVIDRYQVEATIGAGSMGDVVRALDIDLHRPVALKILSDKHRENEELRARFVREGRAVAAISHANVVQVFTTGTFDERPYIAMELLRGTDLGTYVKEHGTMPSLHAARAILDAARGLEAAAGAGLIHRDVKPSNLVMLESGVVKVTDFGLAKPLDPKDEPALTAMGVVVGTPDYIAPEQARGDPIDERVDIYALGGTLYYLLVGSPPFRKGNPAEDKYLKVVARHLKEPAPNPMLVSPRVDRQLAGLQLRMMAKKAAERPTYAELIANLASVVDSLQASSTEAMDTSDAQPATSGTVSPTPFLGGKKRLAELPETDESVPGDATASGAATEDAAETLIRQPQVSEASFDEERALPGPSRWLLGTTLLSAMVFLAGLGLYLFGPIPGPPDETLAVASDASVLVAPPDAAPPPTPPEGFLYVETDAGEGFFIASSSVRYGEFADAFPKEKKPTRNRRRRARPVTGVSFAFAHAFAKRAQGRLPTPEEWRLASEHPDFEAGPPWEWVDDGTEGTQAKQPVVNVSGEAERRRPRGHRDTGFRVAVDIGGKIPNKDME